MKLDTYKITDGELKADFFTRENKNDRDIVDEIWKQHFYSTPGYEIKPFDVVVDIGAHIGSFTVWALKQGANVTAFEPDAENFQLLTLNVQLAEKDAQGAIDLHNVAMKAQEGIFFIERGAPGQRNAGGYKVVEETTGATAETVGAISALEFFKNFPKKIDYLKLDCEGSEYEILEALIDNDLIKNVDKIVMEWHFYPEKAEQIKARLTGAGFNVDEFSTNLAAPLPLGRMTAINNTLTEKTNV